MNISRGVLHQAHLANRAMYPLHTWRHDTGFTWFGRERHSFGYAYAHSGSYMNVFCQRRGDWVEAGKLCKSWGVQ